MAVASTRIQMAFALSAAAAVWPSALCAISDAMASPLQRAMAASWCGGAPQQLTLLGHCPACWSGAATFVLGAMLVLAWPSRRGLRAGA